MQKKYFAALLGSVAISCLIKCSSLDQQTSLGTDIIRDTDSSFMDFNGNFYALSLDSSECVDSAFSLPNELTAGFGKHPGKLAAGNTGDYQTYSYIQFQAGASFARNFDSTYDFDSVVFVFDTLYDTTNSVVGAITSTSRFHLYRCDSINADNLIPDLMPDTATTPICTLTQVTDNDDSWSGMLADTVLADSIFSQCREALSCYNETDGSSSEKIFHCDSALPNNNFFVALRVTGNSLVWFKSSSGHYPAMVIHAHHSDSEKDTTISTIDTLYGYPTLVVSENDSIISSTTSQPLLSWLPGRIAVFKLDLKPLWDTMDSTGFGELLSAGFVASAELLETENNDTIPPVNYFLSADSPTDINDINDRFDTVNVHYNPVINLQKPSEETEIILPVDYHLQHYLDGTQRYFYLYTRLVSRNIKWTQKVLWSGPRFKAILTPTIN